MKITWVDRVQSLLNPEEAREKELLRKAYVRFQRAQPTWVDSLFDWHFLTHHGADVLRNVSLESPEEAARQLAMAWARQWAFGHRFSRRGAMRGLPAARIFVRLLCLVRAKSGSSDPTWMSVLSVPKLDGRALTR